MKNAIMPIVLLSSVQIRLLCAYPTAKKTDAADIQVDVVIILQFIFNLCGLTAYNMYAQNNKLSCNDNKKAATCMRHAVQRLELCKLNMNMNLFNHNNDSADDYVQLNSCGC